MPEYEKTLGPEICELGALANFYADEEQTTILDDIFAIRPGSPPGVFLPAAFLSTLIAPRQNIKTGTFKLVAFGWLFLLRRRTVIWSAHEFKTAAEAFRDMEQMIADTPAFSRRIKTITRSQGKEGIELKTGQRMIFKTRTKAGGRGLSGDDVIMDEGYALQPQHMGALIPTMATRIGAQLIVGSSAGRPESSTLRMLRDNGLKNLPRQAYREYADTMPRDLCGMRDCRHTVGSPDCVMDDRSRWASANSAYNIRIMEEFIEDERNSIEPEEFGRERLGWWDDPVGNPPISQEKWNSMINPDSSPQGEITLGLDVSPNQTMATIVAASKIGKKRTHIEITSNKDEVDSRPGMDWILKRMRKLVGRLGYARVYIVKGSSAESLSQGLEEIDGLELIILTEAEYVNACGQFFDAALSEMLIHIGQGQMTTSIDATRQVFVADKAFKWTKRGSTADITATCAATLAYYGAQNDEGVLVW